MRRLRPITTAGRPGIVAPATVKPGLSMAARYHRAGARSVRWGSLARIGLPERVRAGPMTHEFDARLIDAASRIAAASTGMRGTSASASLTLGSASARVRSFVRPPARGRPAPPLQVPLPLGRITTPVSGTHGNSSRTRSPSRPCTRASSSSAPAFARSQDMMRETSNTCWTVHGSGVKRSSWNSGGSGRVG